MLTTMKVSIKFSPHQLVIKILYIIFVTVCELTKHCRLESDMISLAQPALTCYSKLRMKKSFWSNRFEPMKINKPSAHVKSI